MTLTIRLFTVSLFIFTGLNLIGMSRDCWVPQNGLTHAEIVKRGQVFQSTVVLDDARDVVNAKSQQAFVSAMNKFLAETDNPDTSVHEVIQGFANILRSIIVECYTDQEIAEFYIFPRNEYKLIETAGRLMFYIRPRQLHYSDYAIILDVVNPFRKVISLNSNLTIIFAPLLALLDWEYKQELLKELQVELASKDSAAFTHFKNTVIQLAARDVPWLDEYIVMAAKQLKGQKPDLEDARQLGEFFRTNQKAKACVERFDLVKELYSQCDIVVMFYAKANSSRPVIDLSERRPLNRPRTNLLFEHPLLRMASSSSRSRSTQSDVNDSSSDFE